MFKVSEVIDFIFFGYPQQQYMFLTSVVCSTKSKQPKHPEPGKVDSQLLEKVFEVGQGKQASGPSLQPELIPVSQGSNQLSLSVFSTHDSIFLRVVTEISIASRARDFAGSMLPTTHTIPMTEAASTGR